MHFEIEKILECIEWQTSNDLGGPGARFPGKFLSYGARNRDFLHSDPSFFSFFRVLQYLVITW